MKSFNEIDVGPDVGHRCEKSRSVLAEPAERLLSLRNRTQRGVDYRLVSGPHIKRHQRGLTVIFAWQNAVDAPPVVVPGVREPSRLGKHPGTHASVRGNE